MSQAELIADLVRAGVSPELVGRVAAALADRPTVPVIMKDEQAERRRAADRERAKVRRLTQKSAESADSAPLDKERSPTPPKEIKPPPPQKPSVSSVTRAREPSVREELETVLSPGMATAVIDHRRTIKVPLTVHGAKLLARNLAARGDPEANANLMIERAWRGFKPEWAENDGKRNHSSGRQRGDLGDFAAGFTGFSPQRADDRFGGADDPFGSRAYRDPAGSSFGSSRTIEGRVIAFDKRGVG